MGLQPKTTEESYLSQNTWQKSDHGQQNARTGTLDLTKFETNAAGGVIPDGTPVVFNEATGLYEPAIVWTTSVDPDAYVQEDEAAGHVYKAVSYDAGEERAGFALFWHGLVDASEVPVPTGHAGATFDPAKGAPGVTYV